MRVLIVKTSSMGDIVHALPAASDMARAMPGIRIDWLVEQNFASIPAHHPAVARVIPLQWRKWRKRLLSADSMTALREFKAQLTLQPYDLVIDMQGLIKSALFACLAHGPRGGWNWSSAREPMVSLLYQRKANAPWSAHAVHRCRTMVAQLLDYALPATPPDFGLQPGAATWLPEGQQPFSVLVPCASRPEKLWPEADWSALAHHLKSLGQQVVVLWGSPAEHERAQRIVQASCAVVPPFLSVEQAMQLMAQAQTVVGLDTGLTHIAAALGRPTLGIYCDYEPGLAGVTGSGPVISLGGKGQTPARTDAMAALARLQTTAA